ncbi:MAG: exodeoxyribonuclease I [Candidatus Pelagibacter sp. TMED272]|nr:exodeoxyribonuclease I [Pelagibacteraceae bacterium]RPG93451.1 MAG: exodeoxyribonuclease I [Candidatus Pelagibacter sp. TMED272]|tara:strand:- start:2549 stop:3970 length:1422 start_codon:yes stop_codon:yes gene_type:complete
MSNFVFYDFETSSSNKFWGQIIQIGAVLTNDNLDELDRYDARCRLSPGIIPEAMALIVNKTSPTMLKKSNLSHYEMIRQFVETLKRWGKATYVGFNSIEFDEEFLRSTLFQTLEYPYITSTNGNTRGDMLSLARAANLYYPNTLKNSVNEKGNDVYKLDQMAPLNGIEHGNAHSAIGDVIATIGIAKLISKKAPNVWKASMLTMDKNQSLELIQKELLFCTNEYFYGRSRPYVQTFICQHPQYQWPLCFDLKHDPEPYLHMSVLELTAAMKKQPKFIRTVRHNKHPVIMNPSYGDKFDEYKLIGSKKLEERAKMIKSNKEFAEKVISIKRLEVDEKAQTKSQEDLYNEESIYAKFTSSEDNKIMPEFHSVNWEKKLNVISKFKDERLQYFGKKLLYMEKPEVLTKADFDLIHKDTSKKLLSTNNEKWNTIPRTYSEIDTLRAKFEKENQPEKLKILDDINAYVEDLEEYYSSA